MPDAPEILELKRIFSDLPERVSFKQAWDLRARVADLMLGTNQETRFVLQAGYDKLTELLKARAKELGKENEFAEAERLTKLDLETEQLRADLSRANGEGFLDILNDPARQHELALLNAFVEAGGLPADYLDRAKRSVKATHRVLKSRQAGGPVRLRDTLLSWIEVFKLRRRHRKE
ncbi:MAG TPA: hypothetical protein VKS20_09310 [Candidatus Acidoferrales bacterium]|nr:hypothetical protein [Candidatus Acidoferrales bacterium]